MRWLTRGDIDGFFGLALDNLIQLLLIDGLCRHVLGFSNDLLYGQVLPGAALSLVVGNVYYAHSAQRLARTEQRDDVCALPYGINTVSVFAFVFLVMLPAKLAAEAAGADDPARVAWQAGLVACLGSAVIEIAGSFVAARLRSITPRAALLATLAGIALTFIAAGFLYRTFARPEVGLLTLAIVLLTYFGKLRFPAGLPGGLVAVGLGTITAWSIGIAPVGELQAVVGLRLPTFVFGDLLLALGEGGLITYASVILPMGLFNLLGSLQNLESAEAAGDRYPERSSLLVNGIGSLVAAIFGSCFPTTLYIGHPGWKAMGSRAGYSVLNAAFIAFVALTGTLAHIGWAIPIEAGMAILLWIGIVMTAQAFETTPRSHAPAVVVGLLPGLGAWGALMAKNGLRAAGMGTPDGPGFGPDLLDAFAASDTWIHGAFALEQGFVLSAMILAATTVAVIERRFFVAALWAAAASGLCMTGLMHGYGFAPADTVIALGAARPWAIGYASMAACFIAAHALARRDVQSHPEH